MSLRDASEHSDWFMRGLTFGAETRLAKTIANEGPE